MHRSAAQRHLPHINPAITAVAAHASMAAARVRGWARTPVEPVALRPLVEARALLGRVKAALRRSRRRAGRRASPARRPWRTAAPAASAPRRQPGLRRRAERQQSAGDRRTMPRAGGRRGACDGAARATPGRPPGTGRRSPPASNSFQRGALDPPARGARQGIDQAAFQRIERRRATCGSIAPAAIATKATLTL